MGYKEVCGRMGRDYNVTTAMYRFAVVSRVWGVPLNDEVNVLNAGNRSVIESCHMTETLERLLFLYGAGIIDFTVITELVYMGAEDVDISDVLEDAERLIITQIKEYNEVRIGKDIFTKIFLLCAAARKFMPDESLTFDEARSLCGSSTVKIVDNFVRVTDRRLLELMMSNNEPFGYFDRVNHRITTEDKENILTNDDVSAGNDEGKYYPVSLKPRRVLFYDEISKLLYGADFLEYSIKLGYGLGEDYKERYDKYIRRIKCLFNIRVYHRRRRVCGETYNIFDYVTNVNNTSEKPAKDIEIELIPDKEKTTDELIHEALVRFCSKEPVQNETILEVRNQGKIYLFVVCGDTFKPVDSETFHRRLFDYEKLWGIIHEYTMEHSIAVRDGCVEVPVELMKKFTDEEKPYAEALVKEQYARQSEQGSKKIISTLSVLISGAEEEFKKKEELEKHQAALKNEQAQKLNESMSNRGPSVEGAT